ncbi:hypothetical protein AA313_de0205762 [Arthrobotrys entomopaga]|nr:hypothetical protein AA313_de0205762 [Arthrobotrys entomopaga]
MKIRDKRLFERQGAAVSNQKRTQTPIEIIKTPFRDILAISQPPGATIEELGETFWNYQDAGKNIRVYVLDNGCEMDHPEVGNVNFGDWIFPGAFPSDEQNDQADMWNSELHGTAVIGRVAGRSTGIASKSEIIVVKMVDGRGAEAVDVNIDGLLKTLDEVKDHPDIPTVINMSLNFDNTVDLETLAKGHAAIRQKLVDFEKVSVPFLKEIFDEFAKLANVILVLPAGNGVTGSDIDIYPQLFALDEQISKKLTVVGGYDPYSGYLFGKTADFVKVSAPGIYVNVAARYVNGELANKPEPEDPDPTPLQKALGLKLSAGTSFAAPTAAGAIAAWLSAGIPIDNIISHMQSQAYPRVRGGPPVLYNGISISQWPLDMRPEWQREGKPTLPPLLRLKEFDTTMQANQPTPLVRIRTVQSSLGRYSVTTEILVPIRTIKRNETPLKTIYTDFFANPTSIPVSTILPTGLPIQTKHAK